MLALHCQKDAAMPVHRAAYPFTRAKEINLGSGSASLTDRLGGSNQADRFRFQLQNHSRLGLSLGRFKSNLDLQLLNYRGQPIQTSATRQPAETIQADLGSSTYYIRVYSKGRSRTKYRLNLFADSINSLTDNTLANSNAPNLPISSSDPFSSLSPESSFMPSSSTQPIVTLSTTDVNAAETAIGQPENPGEFTITRTGSIDTALTIYYSLGGTASNTSDYFLDSNSFSVTIPSGQSTVALPIHILNDDFAESTESVTMILSSSAEYALGGSTAGTVMIADNDMTSTTGSFKIQFDYRYDSSGWFTPERKAALETAASVWEKIILDEFQDVPTGTPLRVTNPETDEIYTIAADVPIDDVLVFVGAKNIDGNSGTLAYAGATATYDLGSSLDTRYNGASFEPWTGYITFDGTEGWFFDSTPETANDIPFDDSDFISVALHEIGHILGFSAGIPAFDRFLVNNTFTGSNARAANGGNAIPLAVDASHIQDGYQFSGSGETLMDPTSFAGTRKLPTAIDAGILDDMGYTINYGAVFQN